MIRSTGSATHTLSGSTPQDLRSVTSVRWDPLAFLLQDSDQALGLTEQTTHPLATVTPTAPIAMTAGVVEGIQAQVQAGTVLSQAQDHMGTAPSRGSGVSHRPQAQA